MKVSYKGIHHDLPTKVQEKLDAKFQKLSRLLDGPRGERSAHVVLTQERHLNKAEITLRFYDHQLIGIGMDGDIFNAMTGAIENLEKQALKQRTRWRAKARRQTPPKLAASAAPEAPAAPPKPRIFRVRTHERRKPMTLDEAMLQMEDGRGYLAFRDPGRDSVSMLVRRPDGHFDLIES